MLSVAEARARIVAAFGPLGSEQVGLMNAIGRVLAQDVAARVTQPPADVSAMDGYAVRGADVAKVPARLRVVGQAPAGGSYDGPVGAGEAVRIFTGGPLPAGTDTIIIQEDTTAERDHVVVREGAPRGTYVRAAGLDFKTGDVLLRKGRLLTSRDVGIAAAMNVPWLGVTRRPRIAVLATGDEVVMPGDAIGPHQIVSSNGPSLAAFVAACGGDPIHLGIAPDDSDALRRMAEAAVGADLLVTSGGASVGDHDLVQAVLGDVGLEVDFWKIAMRPGKPLMFGRIGLTPVLGVPGNPVSTLVCATMFLRPAIDAMLGREMEAEPQPTALLGRDLPANDSREDYLRARLSYDAQGRRLATPFDRQDSSMLSLMAAADCLVVRPPRAPAIAAGTTVDIVLLAGGCLSI
ncbi:MAG: molybdopterin molybdotransferase MoeA [Dongiaceae bacterium]